MVCLPLIFNFNCGLQEVYKTWTDACLLFSTAYCVFLILSFCMQISLILHSLHFSFYASLILLLHPTVQWHINPIHPSAFNICLFFVFFVHMHHFCCFTLVFFPHLYPFTQPTLFFFSTFLTLSLIYLFLVLYCFSCVPPFSLSLISRSAAVQEERQRNKDREGEVESTSAVNEEMPVEKILEAEMAVEQKTELHADGSSGGSSVSILEIINQWQLCSFV